MKILLLSIINIIIIMSQLILYKFPPEERLDTQVLLNYLSEYDKHKLYTYKLCCNKNDMYLPKEIWTQVLYYLCDIKKLHMSYISLLYWLDKYIADPRQNRLNPILLSGEGCLSDHLSYFNLFPDLDCMYRIEVNSDPVMNNQFAIYLGDVGWNCELLCGIMVDPEILNIEFRIRDDCIYNIKSNELYEFRLDNIYTYNFQDFDTMKCIRDNTINFTNLPSKYKCDTKTFWSYRDIMPLHVKHLMLHITSVNPIPNIKLLICKPRNSREFRKLFKNSVAYKTIIYDNYNFEQL